MKFGFLRARRCVISLLLAMCLVVSDSGVFVLKKVFASEQGRVIACMRDNGIALMNNSNDVEFETLMDLPSEDEETAMFSLSAESEKLVLVTSDRMDNEELIEYLEGRSDVLFAEEDIQFELDPIETLGDKRSSSEDEEDTYYTDMDYSKFQWGLNNDGTTANGKADYDIGNEDELVGSEEVVIAIMDTGIDYTNPNLKDNMIDLNDYGDIVVDTDCGEYGFNASIGDDSTEIMDFNGHGTHCSGIIGGTAESGPRGVMEDATLLGVKIEDSKGIMWLSSIVRGFEWLAKANNDYSVGIRAVSVSIGGGMSNQSYKMAVKKAERAGIVTIFASGNDDINLDLDRDSNPDVVAESSIIVNAIQPNGTKTSYTNYGLTSTDIYAPGSTILSTVPDALRCFFPFIAAEDDRAVVYEGFEDDDSDVDKDVNGGLKFYYFDDDNEDNNYCGEEVEISGNDFLRGEKSLRLEKKGEEDEITIISEPMDLSEYASEANGQLYIGLGAFPDKGKIGVYCDYKLEDGSFTSNEDYILCSGSQWYSSGNNSHVKVSDDVDWENFQLKMTLFKLESGMDLVYMDCVGIGTGLEPYAFYGGTSMATPMVSGVFGLLCGEYPDESSEKISARVKGGAIESKKLDDCLSGGYINVQKAATDPDPVVVSSRLENDEVIIEGYFMDELEEILIDGKKAEIISQNDLDDDKCEVVLQLPQNTKIGVKLIDVTCQDGRSGRGRLVVDSVSSGFEGLSLPTDYMYDSVVETTMAVVEDDIYLFGMIENAGYFCGIWKYSVEEDEWEFVDAFPDGYYIVNAEYYNGKLYALSQRYDGVNFIGGTVITYDINTGESKDIGIPDSACYGQSLIVYDGKLLLMGGFNSVTQELTDDVFSYDLKNEKWVKRYTLPEPMASIGSVVSGDKLFLMYAVDSDGEVGFQIYSTDFNKTRDYGVYFFEQGQALSAAMAATKKGIMISGMVKEDDGVMYDTWELNKTTGKLRASDKMLSSAKTYSQSGAQTDGYFYVWGTQRNKDTVSFFRRTEIEEPVVEKDKEPSHDGGYTLPEITGDDRTDTKPIETEPSAEFNRPYEDNGQEIGKKMNFSDVSAVDWFYEAVKYVYENGIMNGISDNEFLPKGDVTRAMVVSVLYRLCGSPQIEGGSGFTDVDDSQYYAQAVAWAKSLGIVKGFDNGKFEPNEPITREQLAVILFNYFNAQKDNLPDLGKKAAELSDYSNIQSWAKEAVDWAVSTGVMSGREDGSFDPNGRTTRAEIASVIERIMKSKA